MAILAFAPGCRCTVTTATCGDGICDIDEFCDTCSVDCGACATCGDGFCDASEFCDTCATDCGACPVCGDGTCDAGEDATCEDCAFTPGDMLTYSLTAADPDDTEVATAFGISITEIEGAFAVAKPGNTYDFAIDWGQGDIGTYWVGIYALRSGADITVRGVSATHDLLMVCESPDGSTLFANDDFDTTACVNMGICDPGMVLIGQDGAWLCLFAVAPFTNTGNTDPFATLTMSVE